MNANATKIAATPAQIALDSIDKRDFYCTARLAVATYDAPNGGYVGVKHAGDGWYRVYTGVAGKSDYIGLMTEHDLREFCF